MEVKQVLVIRKDLKMRRGKEIAQGSHASMAFLTRRLREAGSLSLSDFTEAERQWLSQRFTKVCLQAGSEEELRQVIERARAAGLRVEPIVDAGATEFHGTPTLTCCAIGPDDAARIDAVTGDLKLY